MLAVDVLLVAGGPVVRLEVVPLPAQGLPAGERGAVGAEVGAAAVGGPLEPAAREQRARVGEVVVLSVDVLLVAGHAVAVGGVEVVGLAAQGLPAGERGAVLAEVGAAAVGAPRDPAVGEQRAGVGEVVVLPLDVLLEPGGVAVLAEVVGVLADLEPGAREVGPVPERVAQAAPVAHQARRRRRRRRVVIGLVASPSPLGRGLIRGGLVARVRRGGGGGVLRRIGLGLGRRRRVRPLPLIGGIRAVKLLRRAVGPLRGGRRPLSEISDCGHGNRRCNKQGEKQGGQNSRSYLHKMTSTLLLTLFGTLSLIV